MEPQSEAKWVVDGVDVTDVLQKYRNQVVTRQSRGQSLSDTNLLALDNIYPFGRDILESTPVFTAEQHEKIISSIALLQKTTKSSENVRRWCETLSEESSRDWKTIKRTIAKFLGEAENEFDLIGAETIHSMSGRLLKEAERNMLEDSFAHKILDPIFETIFGSSENLKQDWANGFLLPSMKRKREEIGDEEVYKPDWIIDMYPLGCSPITYQKKTWN